MIRYMTAVAVAEGVYICYLDHSFEKALPQNGLNGKFLITEIGQNLVVFPIMPPKFILFR